MRDGEREGEGRREEVEGCIVNIDSYFISLLL